MVCLSNLVTKLKVKEIDNCLEFVICKELDNNISSTMAIHTTFLT